MFKRFLFEGKIDKNVILNGEEHNHLSSVLRLKIGDNVILINGDEYDYICKIISIDKKQSVFEVVDKKINLHNPRAKIDVFQALLKNDKMSIVVQKLSELGISKIYPFETKFQTVKPSENKKDKLQKISDQSSKQCKRSIPMQVMDINKFEDILLMFKNYDLVIFANECEDAISASEIIDIIKDCNKVAIIIGSEGGFDKIEIEKIISNGAKSISLGNRILRGETASIALSAFVSLCLNN